MKAQITIIVGLLIAGIAHASYKSKRKSKSAVNRRALVESIETNQPLEVIKTHLDNLVAMPTANAIKAKSEAFIVAAEMGNTQAMQLFSLTQKEIDYALVLVDDAATLKMVLDVGTPSQKAIDAALKSLSQRGDSASVKLLMDLDIKPTPSAIVSAVQMAIQDDQVDLCRQLLSADWEASQSETSGLFRAAIFAKQIDVARCLLKKFTSRPSQVDVDAAFDIIVKSDLPATIKLYKDFSLTPSQTEIDVALAGLIKNMSLSKIKMFMSAFPPSQEGIDAAIRTAATQNRPEHLALLLSETNSEPSEEALAIAGEYAGKFQHARILKVLKAHDKKRSTWTRRLQDSLPRRKLDFSI